jgi:predicted DNA-binding transcriptional regulator AlpA
MAHDSKGKRRPLVPDTEAAKILGLEVGTLRNKRSAGLPGPPFVRLGRSIRYDLDDIEAYIAAHRVDPNRRAG